MPAEQQRVAEVGDLRERGVPQAGFRSSLEHLRAELERLDVLVRGQVARAREAAGAEPYRGLAISEAEVDALLERPLSAPPWHSSRLRPSSDEGQRIAARLAEALAQTCRASRVRLRLGELAARFGLDRFDLDVLLIALAPEFDLRYERLYAYLHDDVTRKRPSVDLALHLLCASFEERCAARARFEAGSVLLRARLIQLLADPAQPAPPLVALTLKVDERLVGWLQGSSELEARLARHARRQPTRVEWSELLVPPELAQLLEQWASDAGAPAIYLQGPAGVGKRTIAQAIARRQTRTLLSFDATLETVPDDAAAELVHATAREAALEGDLLLVQHADVLLNGERAATRAALLSVLSESPLPIVLTGERRLEPRAAAAHGPTPRREHDAASHGLGWPAAPADNVNTACARADNVMNPAGPRWITLEVALPTASQREPLWRAALHGQRLADGVETNVLAAEWQLSGGQIHAAARLASALTTLRHGSDVPLGAAELAEACREHSVPHLGQFARAARTRACWADLVLPEDHLHRLREICAQARHRALVHETWGFAQKPGSTALAVLFSGPPGTGKTLAASVLAAELGRELYTIDLSRVVSKWVGETEKALSRIFDEAERSSAVLFFDEADALFGKRTEVHDAHDRYANIETSYLLQRLEDYTGMAILASNFKRNMDDAFVRRLRFILEFPLPDERQRLQIWQRVFPAATPRTADLDLPLVARRYELAGAHIRNIALSAAFLAANEGRPVAQRHLLHAARREYQKQGKMVEEAMFRSTS